MSLEKTQRFWTVPNALSLFRLLSVPVLVLLAWKGVSDWFLWLLVVSLVTDILDGNIARWLNQVSEWGARLDSWADFAAYMTLPVCAYWLRPEVVETEAVFFWMTVAAYTLPVLYGFLKFGTLTSYHTRNAVIGAYILGGATIVIFAGGPTWPFRIGAVFIALAELEEIAITTVLAKPVSNVKGLKHALALRKAPTTDLSAAG